VDPGIKIVSDILGNLPDLIPPTAPQNNFQPPVFNPRPVVTQPTGPTFVRPAPTQQVQPLPRQPQVVNRPAPANPIVTRKQYHSLNQLSNPVSFNLDTTQAETDARQEVEAAQAVDILNSDISASIGSIVTKTNDTQMNADWNEVTLGGNKTEDVQKFLEKYGPNGNNKLPADVVEMFEIRQEFATYADGLRAGTFTTPEERDTALADLQTSLEQYVVGKNPTYAATLQEKMTNMQNYNTLGKLAVATAETENPYPTLVQGATQAEMPLAFVCEMTGYPVMGVEPIAEQQIPTESFTPTAASITIANPAANAQGVAYRLSTYDYTMSAGDEQTLDRSYVLSFDNGAGAQKSYTLTDGYYEWRLDPQAGWDLYKIKVTVVLDNSRHDGPFQYLLQGEPQTIAAGEVVEFTSDNLIEVAFHSGREGIEHFKRLKPGMYIVGLDPDYGALDLFPATKVEAFEAKQPPYLASTEQAGSHATKAQRVEALLAQIKKPGDQPAAKAEAAKPAGKSAAKKGVSPLGKKAPAASAEDLLKSIKPKAASGEKATGENYEVFQLIEGQPGGPFPVKDGQSQIPVIPVAPGPGLGSF